MVSEPDRTRSEQDHQPAGAFRLRTEGPPVMRLSRKVLTGLVGVGAIVVFGALIFALYQGNRRPGDGAELYSTQNKTTPDGLSNLPRDYTGLNQDKPQPEVPRLGPPVPGDIGSRRRRSRPAAPCRGKRGSAHQPPVRHHQCEGAPCDCISGRTCCGPEDGAGRAD